MSLPTLNHEQINNIFSSNTSGKLWSELSQQVHTEIMCEILGTLSIIGKILLRMLIIMESKK